MRIRIDRDEWYPVYSHHQNATWWAGESTREISDADLSRLNRAFDEFKWAQDLLEKSWQAGTSN